MSKTIGVHDIEVGERARIDLGDLADLMASIKQLGLLQPIVVSGSNKLIAGGRRLESCRRLGLNEVPVVVAEHIHDAVDLLKAERDENTCRKPMTASELIALGRQIEELEKPHAKAAQVAGARAGAALTNRGEAPSVPANERRFDSREKAAEAVGLSTATYSRIKQVANAAEGVSSVSPERQEESRESLALLDRITSGEEVRPVDGGRPLTVTAVYEKWKGHKANRGDEAPAERRRTQAAAATPVPPLLDSRGRRMPQRSQRKSLAEGVSTLSGLCVGFASVTELDASIDAEEAARWARDLSEALRVLRSLNNKLKERTNGNH